MRPAVSRPSISASASGPSITVPRPVAAPTRWRAAPFAIVPLKAPMRTRGVLALEPRNPRRLMIPEQRRLLDTFARLIAISLERVHYVDVAQTTTVQMESERLRNSLLSAISHDLRTPARCTGRPGRLDVDDPAAADRAAGRNRRLDARGGAAHELAGQQSARHGAPAVRHGQAQPAMAAAGGGRRQRPQGGCVRPSPAIASASSCRKTCPCSSSTPC